MNIELTDEETIRYNRQIVLRGFDFDGQEALKSASVLIVGVGGLGCSASQYLAAAGVGKLTLLDFDTVSLSNLQRQILHRDTTIGQPKVLSAKATLEAINPNVIINTVNALLEEDALNTLIKQHNIVMDCTDNVMIREQLNRLCFQQKKPLVSGAAIRMEGQISVFTYQNDEPCYRCLSHLFGDNALSCVEAGIMAPVVGTIGTLQAVEAIKLLTGYGENLYGKVLMFDAMRMQFREFKLPKNPHCEVCSTHSPDN
ncbi:molybdopterin-synthase adenylyltransferase MoeB [Proteus hauseri]|uniref:molybdopterin-synthase adenylyltransferase MoeB n=1 Tax=Proteus hauseri TaxID=183417 RepID=UPI0010096024|nr:molybdopterin-synthase adenylyltransferase MoeB [Proteus hauseri]QAV24136.1 molybdopterin-synthase adenylyltransferase MoeB [Proteus hauseri]